MDTAIQCLYCNRVIESRITIHVSVERMRKHVKEAHPGKPLF